MTPAENPFPIQLLKIQEPCPPFQMVSLCVKEVPSGISAECWLVRSPLCLQGWYSPYVHVSLPVNSLKWYKKKGCCEKSRRAAFMSKQACRVGSSAQFEQLLDHISSHLEKLAAAPSVVLSLRQGVHGLSTYVLLTCKGRQLATSSETA